MAGEPRLEPSLRAALAAVDASCSVTCKGLRSCHFTTARGLNVSYAPHVSHEPLVAANVSAAPLLCTLHHPLDAPHDSPLMLMIASDFGYLTRPGVYFAMLAKIAYARLHGMRALLWVGGEALLRGQSAPPPSWCRDDSLEHTHLLKVPATLAAFREQPSSAWLVYLDADAVPVASEHAALRGYLALAEAAGAEFVGSSNVVRPILINGGVYIVRNSAWARGLMREWWSSRCSLKDQLPLWRTWFARWAAAGHAGGGRGGAGTAAAFRVDGEGAPASRLFETYESARRGVLAHVIAHRAEVARAPWACGGGDRGGVCAAVLERTGCLVEPLLLGRLLLLPLVPFSTAAEPGANRTLLPPLQGRDEGESVAAGAWSCHNLKKCVEAVRAQLLAGAQLLSPGAQRDEARRGEARGRALLEREIRTSPSLGPRTRALAEVGGGAHALSRLSSCRRPRSPDFFVCPCYNISKVLSSLARGGGGLICTTRTCKEG